MKSIRFRRKRAAAEATRISAKDVLTVGMSFIALIVSGIALYLNSIQTTDDLAIVAAVTPELSARQDGRLQLADADVSVVFVNAGSRPAAITSFSVTMSQLRKDGIPTGEECLDEMVYEDHTKSYRTDFVPLVLKEKEVTLRQLKLVPKSKEPDLAFPISRDNRGEKSFPIVMCFNVDAATVSDTRVYKYQIVRRWQVSKSSLNDRYEVTSEGEDTNKPMPMYRHRGTIFSD
jgi:hypothetical protein